MEHYAGIAVSLESASRCVVDATGRLVREAKMASEPEVPIGWYRGLGLAVAGSDGRPGRCRNGCMRACGMPGCRLNCSRPGTSGRIQGDAGQNRPQGRARYCSTDAARLVRASAADGAQAVQSKNHDVEMSLRGVLRGFGLKVGPTTREPSPAGAVNWSPAIPHCQRSPRRCIAKIGDGGGRTALYEAANVILTRPVKGSTLKSWGMRLAARAGMRKAKVALARKLAVALHRMLAAGTTFLADKADAAAAH